MQTNKSHSNSSRNTKVAFVGLAVPLTKWYNITKSKNVDTHWFENVSQNSTIHTTIYLWAGGARMCSHARTHTPACGVMTELGQSHEGNANTPAELAGRPTHTRSLVSNYSCAYWFWRCARAHSNDAFQCHCCGYGPLSLSPHCVCVSHTYCGSLYSIV